MVIQPARMWEICLIDKTEFLKCMLKVLNSNIVVACSGTAVEYP